MIAPASAPISRTRGRPRAFDVDAALDGAISVFSSRGYHAASISELTQAMGVTPGSVYKAFKDKRAVFLAAFQRYRGLRSEKLRKYAQAGDNGRERVRLGLTFYAEASHGLEGCQGCLVVSGATELALFDAEIAEQVAAAFARTEDSFRGWIDQGRADGSIRADLDAASAARLMLCIIQGARIIGKTGRGRDEMLSLVDLALKALD